MNCKFESADAQRVRSNVVKGYIDDGFIDANHHKEVGFEIIS